MRTRLVSGAPGNAVADGDPDPARRTNEARGREMKLMPTWSTAFGPEIAGNVLLPGEGARIAPATFDEWLVGQR